MAKQMTIVGLRALREEAGLSREQLARRLAKFLTAHAIYNLEGGTMPKLDTALALRRALSDALGREISIEEVFPEIIAVLGG